MRRENKKKQLFFIVILALCIMVCGKKAQAAEPEQEPEQILPDNVIVACATEDIEYVDEVMPAQYTDDLSLLADIRYADNTYAYQDGKVYYRRYHEDSYEETALRGLYSSVIGTKKEIVCIDADGVETELFADKGCGDIYLIGDRFYMQEKKVREVKGGSYIDTHLYSVDMKGNNRIDYGKGSIFAIDKERNIIILEIWEEGWRHYYAMNYETGEKKEIFSDFSDNYISVNAYQDGWLYYSTFIRGDGTVDWLCAVSLEGEQREIIALTSDSSAEKYSYHESICQHIEVDEERIYFIYGGYAGSAHVFQGGKLISVKLDGTDYRAVETNSDTFYLSHDNGKSFVYFPRFHAMEKVVSEKYHTMVWDVDADICALSEFPQELLGAYDQEIGMWTYYPAKKSALCELVLYEEESDEEQTNICAVPGDYGKVVKIAINLEDGITKRENEKADKVKYEDLYYADGFLYFTVEYSIYDEETSIGWRDGYRRLHSDVYRLKIGESKAEVLYSY